MRLPSSGEKRTGLEWATRWKGEEKAEWASPAGISRKVIRF